MGSKNGTQSAELVKHLQATKVAVVDYGLANIQSVVNALECFTPNVVVAEAPDQLVDANKIVLPGVGHFDAGMQGLRGRGHIEALTELTLNQKIPTIGICLGFQFLFEGSGEGIEPGLGWLPGRCEKITERPGIKVPHMGWSEVSCPRSTGLMSELTPPYEFYFVHSYCVPCVDDQEPFIAATCDHGTTFVAAVEHGNIFGTQFHPEKSQLAGMKLLETFLLS